MSINLHDIAPSQDSLRDLDQIARMVEYVRAGGIWSAEAISRHADLIGPTHRRGMIAINEFPDGWRLLHDGHHRATATVLGGRELLHDEECVVTRWRYEDYLDINLRNGWVTPYDPRIEVRVADFYPFKKKVLLLARQDVHAAIRLIRSSVHLYVRPRVHRTIPELAAWVSVRMAA